MRENVSLNSQYQAVLTDLQQMKADAEDGIRAIKRLMARSYTTAPVPVQSESEQANGSTGNQIVAFLESRNGRSYKPLEIATALGKQITTVRGALARLAKKKKIGKHGRGKYRARRSEITASDAT